MTQAEHAPIRGIVVPAAQVDRSRVHEDLSLLAELGAKQVRVGLDWEWMQPSAGAVNGDAVELYLGLTQLARSLDVTLQFTLFERAMPRWFDNEGGFTDAKWAGHWWPRWVEVCADAFGDTVGGWVPIEHPLAVANCAFPTDPRRHGEVLDTLIDAWRDAWRLLRGGPPVITAFGLETVRPVDQTIPAEHAAKRLDQIRWRLWLQGLRDGVVSIPDRADREVPDLAGACDILGVIVRHEQDTLGLVHRAAEQGLDRPMAVTFLTPSGADAGRETAIERFVAEAVEAASGAPLTAMAISPAFDMGAMDAGIITRDRELKDSGRMFFPPTS